jgi:hypothetical protein
MVPPLLIRTFSLHSGSETFRLPEPSQHYPSSFQLVVNLLLGRDQRMRRR